MTRKYREPDWPRLMTIEAACAYLQLDRELFLATIGPTVRAHKFPDRVIRYDRNDLDEWVNGHREPRRTDDDWLREISDGQHSD